jgi:hypothetical protein
MHKPLKKDEFLRLIRILPGEGPTIQCELVEASAIKESHCPYEALSYCWGPSQDKIDILLNKENFPVTQNLHSALCRLRQKYKPRLLWIDALCINQDDPDERSCLVQKMASIFSDAQKVVVDLGTVKDGAESDENARAMKLIAEIGRLGIHSRQKVLDIAQDADRAVDWVALGKLLGRPYWRRVWIAQEVAVAADINVICGREVVTWAKFGPAIEVLVDLFIEGDYGRASNFQYLKLAAAWAVQTSRDRYQPNKQKSGLAELLITFRNSESSDPRDQVYGLLNLSNAAIKITPDYSDSKPVAHVYMEATRHIIETTGSLNILSALDYGARHEGCPGLPSWCPNFAAKSPPNLPFFKLEYNAAGGKMAQPTFEGRMMTLKGYKLDIIAHAKPTDSKSVRELKSAILQNLRLRYRTDSEKLVALFDTLYVNFRDHILQKLKALRGHESGHWRNDVFLVWYLRRLLEEGDKPWRPRDGRRGLTSIANGRKIFISITGHVGLVPDAALRGDVLVILPGGRVPFCIRKKITDFSKYEIVGDW